MAGVNVAVRGDGHILAARSAAPQALDDAGPLGQIHIKVEEVHILPAHELTGQLLVLRINLVQILLLDGKGVIQRTTGRLHRYMAEAERGQMHHILGKVQVFPGKGAPGIVVLGAASGHQLLKFRNNDVIAPLPACGGAHVVVDVLPAIQREHHVGHLPVDVVDVLVTEEHPVCGDGESEHLVMLLLQRAGVLHRLFHSIHGH